MNHESLDICLTNSVCTEILILNQTAYIYKKICHFIMYCEIQHCKIYVEQISRQVDSKAEINNNTLPLHRTAWSRQDCCCLSPVCISMLPTNSSSQPTAAVKSRQTTCEMGCVASHNFWGNKGIMGQQRTNMWVGGSHLCYYAYRKMVAVKMVCYILGAKNKFGGHCTPGPTVAT